MKEVCIGYFLKMPLTELPDSYTVKMGTHYCLKYLYNKIFIPQL
jgi:hypothetical protein